MPIDRDEILQRAEKCLRHGRLDGAIAEYVRLVTDYPHDWTSVNALGDLYVRAGHVAEGVAQFTRVADSFLAQGMLSKAAAVYRKILKLSSDDDRAVSQLGEIAAAQGLLADAKQHLRQLAERRRARGDARGAAEAVIRIGTIEERDASAKLEGAYAAEGIGDAPRASGLLQEAAALLAAEGRRDDAFAALMHARQLAPLHQESELLMARLQLGAGRLEDAWPAFEAAADIALLEGNMAEAIARLEEFTAAAPTHRPALIRLIGAYVDARDEEGMRTAQVRLADAYLAQGQALEARAVANDLVAACPGNPEYATRLANALQLLGDLAADGAAGADEPPAGADSDSHDSEPRIGRGDAVACTSATGLGTGVCAVADPTEGGEAFEIDLSDALSELAAAAPEGAPPAGDAPDLALETVFERLRVQGARDAHLAHATERFSYAQQLLLEGETDAAITELEAAVRVPTLRFQAAAQLGRVHVERGDVTAAIEWFERALEAPAPDADGNSAVLYELAKALEHSGERARALAVLLELEADTAAYRDVTARIERLSTAPAESEP